MPLWSIYWILRAVDSVFLLLFILFLTWYLYLWTRNSAGRQAESETEYQAVDTETDNINVNSSRYGIDVINEKSISSPQVQRRHQERERMIQQFKEEKDSEIAKLDSTSSKKRAKQRGEMLGKDYYIIQTNFMFLIDNIQDPTRLSQSLFSSEVFDSDDVRSIKESLQKESPRDATEKLLLILLHSGRNAFQPFLKCLVEVGYNQVIERLQRTPGESSNQQSEEVRLIEEREALMEWVNKKEKRLRKVIKEKKHKLQMLQEKNDRIRNTLDKLRKKMAKMENEKQSEKDERLQEISRLRAREDELLKNQEEIRENHQRISHQIQNLAARVGDLLAATISRENELPKLQSDATYLFTLLQRTATAEDESSNLGNSENLDKDENFETFDVCSHCKSPLKRHPVISTVPDLGSTAEVILGGNVDEEQDTGTNFRTLDDACPEEDLNNLNDFGTIDEALLRRNATTMMNFITLVQGVTTILAHVARRLE